MKLNKSKRGISLIVLVITIVVMIILASAIILSLSGSDIRNKANEAVSSNDIATAKELIAVAQSEWEINYDELIGEYDDFKAYADKKLERAGISNIVTSNTGAVNRVYTDKNGDTAIIPEGFVASGATGENVISQGLVIYEGKEAVTDSNVEKAQETRNQFVWVPVPDFSKFKRTTTYDGTITDPGANYSEPSKNVEAFDHDNQTYTPITLSMSNDLTGEWKEYTEMKESVEKNKGFYIGRYEAGMEEEYPYVAGSKKGMSVGGSTWGYSMANVNGEYFDSGRSMVDAARRLYKNSKAVAGTMCYGVQWDSALQFIYKTDPNYPTTSDTKKGYYSWDENGDMIDESKESVELAGFYAVNNIYDMAGNAHEFTMEAEGTRYRVMRGGNDLGTTASYREGRDPWNGHVDEVSFRMALYIK